MLKPSLLILATIFIVAPSLGVSTEEIILDGTQLLKEIDIVNDATKHHIQLKCPTNAQYCKSILTIEKMFCLENSNTTSDPTYLVFTFSKNGSDSEKKERVCQNITTSTSLESDLGTDYDDLVIQPVGYSWAVNSGKLETSAKIMIHFIVVNKLVITSALQQIDLYLDKHHQYEITLDEPTDMTSEYQSSLLVNLNKMKCVGTGDYLSLNVTYLDDSTELIKWCELDEPAKSKSIYKVKSVLLAPFGNNWAVDNGVETLISFSRQLQPKEDVDQKCPEGYFNCQQSYTSRESIICIPESWTCDKRPNCGELYVHADESPAICEKDSGNDDYYYQYFYLHEIERLRAFIIDLLLYHSGLTVLVIFIVLLAFMLKLMDMHSRIEIQLRRLANSQREWSPVPMTNNLVSPPNYFNVNTIQGSKQ